MVSRGARSDLVFDLPMARLIDLNAGEANVGVEILCSSDSCEEPFDLGAERLRLL